VNGTEQPIDTRTAAGKCFLDMLQHRSQRGPYLFLFAPAELCKCLEVFGERSGHAVLMVLDPHDVLLHHGDPRLVGRLGCVGCRDPASGFGCWSPLQHVSAPGASPRTG
jgi:hypothetical protein